MANKTPTALTNFAPIEAWLASSQAASKPVAFRVEATLTLGQLRQEVQQLVSFLQERPEANWALCFEDTSYFVTALLACLYTNKQVVIPGNCLAAPLNELQSEFDAVVTDIPDLTKLAKPSFTTQELLAANLPLAELTKINPASCLTMFTSGSTGKPKKILKSLAAMNTEARWLAEVFATKNIQQLVATVPHQHLYGLTFKVWLPLSLDIPFTSQLVTYQEELAAHLQKTTLLITSPAFIKRLDPNLNPSQAAGVVSAGGVLEWPEAAKMLAWCNCPVTEIYGSTETGVLAWRSRTNAQVYWQAFTEVNFAQQPDGKVVITSPLIGRQTSITSSDNLEFIAPNKFKLLGRLDRTVKIEEKRLSLDSLEQRIKTLAEVADVSCLVLNTKTGQRLGAVVVLSEQGKTMQAKLSKAELTKQLRQQLRPWLDAVALPRYWRFVAELPVNSVGKLATPLLQEFFNDVTHTS